MTGGGRTAVVARGEGGREVVELRHESGSAARVHLQGAHVTSWRTADGRERLFLSSASRYEDGVAIRGGIPVIFPQFADRGPLVKHGFARLSPWRLLDSTSSPAEARFGLEDSGATRAIWPASFALELAVALGPASLQVTLAVAAHSDLEFTAALHTYLAVDDVERAIVTGLEGARFESRGEGVVGGRQPEAALRVRGELDRVYYDVTRPVVVKGERPDATVVVEADGFPDVVLWNPGAEKGGALGDLGAGESRRMLCVEAAVVGAPVRLREGAEWRGRQTLRVRGAVGEEGP